MLLSWDGVLRRLRPSWRRVVPGRANPPSRLHLSGIRSQVLRIFDAPALSPVFVDVFTHSNYGTAEIVGKFAIAYISHRMCGRGEMYDRYLLGIGMPTVNRSPTGR